MDGADRARGPYARNEQPRILPGMRCRCRAAGGMGQEDQGKADPVSREKPPAFQFYAADWLADERLSVCPLEVEGAYIRLLAYAWREGSIPADPAAVSVLCKGASSQTVAMALQFFIPSEVNCARLVNEKMEEIRKSQRSFVRKQKANAVKRWGKKKSIGDLAMPNGCHGITKIVPWECSASASASSITTNTGDDNFAEQFTPEYSEVLSEWEKARKASGLSFVRDRKTQSGASRIAQMVRVGEITIEQARNAMASLLLDSEARGKYTLDGLANNISVWVDGGPAKNSASGKPASASPAIPAAMKRTPEDFCESCEAFIGARSREITVSLTTGEKKMPACRHCGAQLALALETSKV